jgi:hypothetical protein
LNRYSFVRNNPLKYVDPSGHADKDPWKESICKILPMFCQPQSPPLRINEQNEAQLTVSQPIVTTGGVVIVKASSSEEEGKKGGGGGLLNLIRSLLSGLGGGAAKKVVDEVSKDGDPTNEVINVYQMAGRLPVPKGMTLPDVGKIFEWGEGQFGGRKSLELAKNLTSEYMNKVKANFNEHYVTALRDGYVAWVKELADNGMRASPNAAERAYLLTKILERWDKK